MWEPEARWDTDRPRNRLSFVEISRPCLTPALSLLPHVTHSPSFVGLVHAVWTKWAGMTSEGGWWSWVTGRVSLWWFPSRPVSHYSRPSPPLPVPPCPVPFVSPSVHFVPGHAVSVGSGVEREGNRVRRWWRDGTGAGRDGERRKRHTLEISISWHLQKASSSNIRSSRSENRKCTEDNNFTLYRFYYFVGFLYHLPDSLISGHLWYYYEGIGKVNVMLILMEFFKLINFWYFWIYFSINFLSISPHRRRPGAKPP